MNFVVQLGGELLLSILGGIISFLIDKKTGSSRQLLRVLRKNRSSFCISSKRVVPVKYSRQKDFVVDVPMVAWASRRLVSTYFRVPWIQCVISTIMIEWAQCCLHSGPTSTTTRHIKGFHNPNKYLTLHKHSAFVQSTSGSVRIDGPRWGVNWAFFKF